jgi:hypothetical protein
MQGEVELVVSSLPAPCSAKLSSQRARRRQPPCCMIRRGLPHACSVATTFVLDVDHLHRCTLCCGGSTYARSVAASQLRGGRRWRPSIGATTPFTRSAAASPRRARHRWRPRNRGGSPLPALSGGLPTASSSLVVHSAAPSLLGAHRRWCVPSCARRRPPRW